MPLRTIIPLFVACLMLGGCNGDAASDTEREEVVVFAPYLAEDAAAFRAVLGQFTDETGIATRYVGSASFEERIRERVREGDPPDVAIFPEPALVTALARDGYLVPLPDEVSAAATESYRDELLELGVVDGIPFGIPVRLSVKSLVWYPPAAFAEGGYAIPTTWDQLVSLTDLMATDGLTPFCMGFEAFDATGWVGTDWIEDIVLRFHGPDLYSRWVSGEVPFTDDRVRSAFETFGDLVLGPGRVLGGTRAILSMPTMRAIDPMFEDPPQCMMSRQASFQEAALPDTGIEVGADGAVDVFVVPSIDGDEAPLVVGTDLAAAFDDDEDVMALMAYLADPVAGEPWAELTGYTAPYLDFDESAYATEFERRVATLVADADVIRVDASDQMPPAVGTGTFYAGMVDFVGGAALDVVLEHIQAGWPDG